MGRLVRATLIGAAILIGVSACGGGSDPAPAGRSTSSAPPSTTADTGTSQSSTTATTEAPSTTLPTAEDPAPSEPTSAAPVTTTTAVPDAFEVIITAAAQATPGTPGSEVGTPDFEASAAVSADLAAAGLPTDVVGIWVLPVAGSDERLLVFEAYPDSADIDSDSDADLFEVIASSPAIADAGVTRVVFHYFDTDGEGDFVLTVTLPFEALVRYVNEDADVRDQVLVQQRRVDWSSP